MKITELTTPAFLVDKGKFVSNCQRMLARCRELGIELRAQTKTHKTIEGAIIQTGGTRQKLVVSTLAEADYYTSNGFDDILYGFPLIAQHIPKCWQLSRKLRKFHLLIDSETAIQALEDYNPPFTKYWSVFIKIDAGNGRAGVWWQDTELLKKMASRLVAHDNTRFEGLYIHCGNSYGAEDVSKVLDIRHSAVDVITHLANALESEGIKCNSIGIGSTPTCSHDISDEQKQLWKNLTEIHPGNYVFYDAQQVGLGSCSPQQVACRVVTRVIGHYPRRKQILIDCGFLGLTKQGFGALPIPGYAIFDGQPNLKLVHMTQEIGNVEAIDDNLDFEKYPIGSCLFIIPYHACATASMYLEYYVHDGDEVLEEWEPMKGW